MKPTFWLSCALACLALAPLAGQQTAPPPPSQPPPAQKAPPCAGPEFRQLDFWTGAWKVSDPAGMPLGSSEVTVVSSGCALREQWTGNDGVTGTSLSYYDRGDGSWHQLWVGGGGMVLHLTGKLEDGAMVLYGDRKLPQGAVRDRLAWSVLPGGGVRQEWKLSFDGGKTWNPAFEGIYKSR
jgi:hypothetical protein